MPWPQTLISDKQLEEIRKLPVLGMQTTVSIHARSTATPPADDYGDDYLSYDLTNETRRGEVKGWFYSTPAQTQDVDTGMVVTTTTYRLLLPVGTVIYTGDHVVVGTDEYTVSDTDAEGTWLPMLTCNLRKRE